VFKNVCSLGKATIRLYVIFKIKSDIKVTCMVILALRSILLY